LEVHPTTEAVIAGAPAESPSRLSLSECRALLAELERRFDASAALQIDVSWRTFVLQELLDHCVADRRTGLGQSFHDFRPRQVSPMLGVPLVHGAPIGRIPHERQPWCHDTFRCRLAVLRAGGRSHGYVDVRDPGCIQRSQRKRADGGDCGWRRDWVRGPVRWPNLRCLNESRPLVGPCLGLGLRLG